MGGTQSTLGGPRGPRRGVLLLTASDPPSVIEAQVVLDFAITTRAANVTVVPVKDDAYQSPHGTSYGSRCLLAQATWADMSVGRAAQPTTHVYVSGDPSLGTLGVVAALAANVHAGGEADVILSASLLSSGPGQHRAGWLDPSALLDACTAAGARVLLLDTDTHGIATTGTGAGAGQPSQHLAHGSVPLDSLPQGFLRLSDVLPKRPSDTSAAASAAGHHYMSCLSSPVGSGNAAVAAALAAGGGGEEGQAWASAGLSGSPLTRTPSSSRAQYARRAALSLLLSRTTLSLLQRYDLYPSPSSSASASSFAQAAAGGIAGSGPALGTTSSTGNPALVSPIGPSRSASVPGAGGASHPSELWRAAAGWGQQDWLPTGEAAEALPPLASAVSGGQQLYRIGILGGSFNPPTVAHVQAALSALACEAVDEVWIVPCGPRPDKPLLSGPGMPSGAQRLVLTHLAVEAMVPPDVPVRVMPLEVREPIALASYVLMDRLGRWAATQGTTGHVEFHLLIGADLVPTLHTWRHADKLLRETRFLAFPRPGYDSVQGSSATSSPGAGAGATAAAGSGSGVAAAGMGAGPGVLSPGFTAVPLQPAQGEGAAEGAAASPTATAPPPKPARLQWIGSPPGATSANPGLSLLSLLPMTVAVSSSEVRARVKAAVRKAVADAEDDEQEAELAAVAVLGSIGALVPPPVAQYIVGHGLYTV